ncbi:ShlB/FhaC/HecB family hemolysin secretion/activation protein [Okeanomitos corallinicola TIOX110]|uniref:ShlB/FhaC/HecB family hemolysin secretion/activation protein n=1 Tax=Okeanomitos corallinicola TIOX110 TaxID=3133117 RepID=A0ABZ2UL87_9CYAN
MNTTKVIANDDKIIVNDGNQQELINSDLNLHLDHSTSIITQTADDNPIQSENNTSESIYVRQIKVIGSTIFSENQLNEIVQSFINKELTPEEIRKAADAITQLYLNENYLNSRAIPVSQNTENTKNGVLVIQIIEGSLSEIQIIGTKRLSQNYIRDRIRIGAKVPLNAIKLEEQLRLLKIDPLLDNIEASLRPSGKVGQSILVVRVQEAKSFKFGLSADNYLHPSIGSERLGIQLKERNLTGIGDELAASYYRSVTGGANIFDFSYQIPMNAMDGKVQLRFAPSNSEITSGDFKDLGIKAESELYEINYYQPIVRTPREELALSLGFSHQNGQTFLNFDQPFPFATGTDPDGVSRTSVIKFAQDYVRRDTQGAWSLRSQFNFGTGLLDATINDDPVPDSRFFSWLGQIQRVQKLNQNHLLILQADLQLTPDSLLPSQQFIIGGGQSIRGYRQNVRSGDNGFRVAIEDRITVNRNAAGLPVIQVIPFTNIGAVWNKSGNPNTLQDQTFLASAGLGLLWNQALGIDNLTMRLDYGIPFIELDDKGNNAQDEGFYFSLRYNP